jgi:hypothetical protein
MMRLAQLLIVIVGVTATVDAFAAGSIIVAAVMGASWVAANAVLATVIAFAINMVVSTVISKALFKPPGGDMGAAGQSPNPGNRQQIPPATDNKLPVVYGDAWLGGTIVDLSISNDNQMLFYVIALCEVTNSDTGQTPDAITFGDIYYGGKRVNFKPDGVTVASLTDESTGEVNTDVENYINFYLYSNGSNSPVNTTLTAIQVMQNSALTYKWNSTKLMSNTAFAILRLNYNSEKRVTGIEQTKFQVRNARYKPGDSFLDYMTNTRYGAALPLEQIDTTSLTALNTYSNQSFTYTTNTGGTATQPRFRFDGTVDTDRTIMQNLQDMSTSCDCLLKYNEITGKWGVIVQSPSYTVAMALSDSNIVSAIQITPIDIASTFNVVEVKFPDKSNQDAFNSATFDLAEIDPALLFPNEPVNKQSLALPLVNDDVRAQYLANRFLKAAREDLQVDLSINFSGFQLEAGDVVTITNANYGWVAKLFRLNKVTETFSDDGSILVKLTMTEYNPAVFDDASITQFEPSPNTGIPDPSFFGALSAPVVSGQFPSAAIPFFSLTITTPSAGITQYAEIWYSAFAAPTTAQLLFAGTSEVQSNGNPWGAGVTLPAASLSNIPAGNWYLFTRMVNSLGTSKYSPASTLLQWRPTTFQYEERYLAVAYANNATGTSGFSFDPRNKAYFGLYNNVTANGGTDPTLYTWYQADVNFGTVNYLLYASRQNRKFSFNVGNAGYVNLGGAFVPTETSVYDSSLWSALLDPSGGLQSFIDLDARTGQIIVAGATGNNLNDGFLSIINNTDGSMGVNLHSFLNFGSGVYTKSFNAATLTIDIYGRVVGFSEQDDFFYTETVYTATAGQTSFSNTHTVGWVLVFRNGILLDPSEYSETSTTVVMANACAVGEVVVIIYMRGVSTSEYYEPLNVTIASSTTNTITYNSAPWNQIAVGDKLTFANTGTPTQYTVQSVNQTTKVVTFTTTIAGATAGATVYRYRAAGSNYAPFTRYNQDVSAINSFSPTTYALNNGFESIYINGSQINEIDYNLTGNTIDGFPAAVTGRMTIIMYTQNNLAVPASNIANTVAYSLSGQLTYPFPNNPLSFEVYANGALLAQGAGYDYTATANNFTLTTAFTNNTTLLNQQTFARIGAA